MLSELNYAAMWNAAQKPPLFTDRELVLMATATPAALVGLSAQIGSLAPGHAADLIVLRKAGDGRPRDAYWTLTHSTPDNLQLVIIGGNALYGDPALLAQFTTVPAEPVTVCGVAKSLAAGGNSFATTQHTLDHALRRAGRFLVPLTECGD